MNSEKRPYHPLTERLPGEERLSRLYQETTSEGPPPGLDVTVLDMARQAVRQKPRRVYFLVSRKWAVPLSLAAALVVTIGIVRSLRHEMESPSSVSSPVGVRSSTPFRVDERDEALHKRREQKQSQVEEAPGTTHQTMKPLGEMADEDTKTPVRRSAPKLTAPAERQERKEAPKFQAQEPLQDVPLAVQSPPPPVPAPASVAGQEKANVGAPTVKPQAQILQQEQMFQGPASRKEVEGASSLQASEDTLRDVTGIKKKTKTEMLRQDTLSPEEWVAEIKKLRQAGKLTEAEASLKAFKQRYPDYPIEKALAR